MSGFLVTAGAGLVVAVAVGAGLVVARVVPRVRVADPECPPLARLANPGAVLMVATAVALAAVAVAATLPPSRWWLWAPYLALGAPLVYVDLRTTFLPRQLNTLTAIGMGIGLLALAVPHWSSAVTAAVGAFGGFAFMYAAYRLSHALGFGDVRLAALTGAVAGQCGPAAWWTALLAGTFLGAVHGLAHAWWARHDPGRSAYFPYGPALWLGPLVSLILGSLR